MSKEWYYIPSSDPAGSDVDDFDDTLDVIMQTGIRDHVTILSSKLEELREIDCIMQNKSSDTYLKSQERRIICPPGNIKAGQYVYDGINYWLSIGVPDNVYGVYEKCVLLLCQYYLEWQNTKGEIVGRWINATSASKYDEGQYTSTHITTESNNFTILMPSDEETDQLYDKRVFMDTSIPKQKVYRITRDDDILYQYGDRGTCRSFITAKSELNLDVDNVELGICDYFKPATQDYYIVGDSSLMVFTENEYSLNIEDIEHLTWAVEPVSSTIRYRVDGSKLFVSSESENDIGSTIQITASINDATVASLSVMITNFL